MTYREETGRVVQLRRQKAVIQLEPSSRAACAFCAKCSVTASGARTLEVERGELEEGQWVRVRIPRVSGYLSALLVFFVPMVLFVAGMLAGIRLESGTGGHGILPVLGGLLGLAVAFSIAWLAERKVSRHARIEVHPLGGEDR